VFAENVGGDSVQTYASNMLSPRLLLNHALIQDILLLDHIRPEFQAMISPSYADREKLNSLGLKERVQLIVQECQQGNHHLLGLDFELKHTDYQQFILEAAALNEALLTLVNQKSSDMIPNQRAFIQKAIDLRLQMIDHYQAPLSVTGSNVIKNITSAEPSFDALHQLMNPKTDWFIPLFDQQRLEVLERECNPPLDIPGEYNPKPFTPHLLATWGCSTQCDHCDGSSVIDIQSCPWSWVMDTRDRAVSPRRISRIQLELNQNDPFRDYYDFVFHKDAGDLYSFLNMDIVQTSGFAPGSVGEQALKKLLKISPPRIVQISVAPSAWMRRIIQNKGPQIFIDYLRNIQEITDKQKHIRPDNAPHFRFAPFEFYRPDDYVRSMSQVFEYARWYNEGRVPLELSVNGRTALLKTAGFLGFTARNIRLNELREGATDEQHQGFLVDNIAAVCLFPDGRVARVEISQRNRLFRTYRTIPGLDAIGNFSIQCMYCDSLTCYGKKDMRCRGRSQIFTLQGLSPSGGYSHNRRLLEQSI